ncbi:hypothetical protein SDC9_20813 [bioreactor metagenome]|uniref:Uncharacterized protein n=1 Tax=bioreactor metagenome TaxID=1076179 RepID=A0A644U7S1_9ZZZZ|nr:hypothetical protein [Desulfitobacterium hafniense]MEA5024585.1 hypothetical protein [Desulfitobacterium hafniense]
MLAVIKAIMVIIAGVLIGMPLLNADRETSEPTEEGLTHNPKETVFTALGEIEFEYQMNKLEDDDYEELKSKYQLQALDLLNEEDQEFDREIEEQLKKHTKNKKDEEA